jgi:hypothetical protein
MLVLSTAASGRGKATKVSLITWAALNDDTSGRPAGNGGPSPASSQGVRSPMEAHGSYRGSDWSPDRLMFHQNLETFAERVGLIVGLQANGKLSQDQAFDEIKQIWKQLKLSRDELLKRG